MSIVLSQKSGKTLVFIREIMEKSGNLFSENGSDPCLRIKQITLCD